MAIIYKQTKGLKELPIEQKGMNLVKLQKAITVCLDEVFFWGNVIFRGS